MMLRIFPLLFLLAGCMVGPDYEQPALPTPDNWHVDLDYQNEDASSLADLRWTEIFQDEQLKQAIQQALENNRNYQIALARIDEARAANRIANATRLPAVDVGFHNELEDESALTNDDPELADEMSLALLFSWELDLWGKNRRMSNAAYANFLAAQYGAQAVRLTLIADVALAYIELQGIESRLGVNLQTLEARERALEIAEKRHKGGLTSKLEVIQSEVEVANTRSQIPQVEQRKLVVENQLSILLGLPPTHTRIDSSLGDQIIPAKVTAGLTTDLITRRPDIMRAEQQLISTSENVGVATAGLLPNIQLTGGFGQQSEDLDELLDSDGDTWIVELDIIAPLFNAGARRADLEASEARFNAARLNYENVVLEALREVSDALNQFHKSTETLQALFTLQEASQEYLRLAEKRYRNGVLAYIDVLDARRQLFEAQIAVSLARERQLFALINLYKALGGGWDSADVEG